MPTSSDTPPAEARTSMQWLELRVPPPLVFLVCAATMGLTRWLLAPAAIDPVLRYGLAASLLAIAGLVATLAVARFRSAETTVNPMHIDRASTLVTDGVYRWSRNPMYLALAVLLCALAVILAVPVAAFGPLCFVLYITAFQIRPEERALQRKFGPDYHAYRSRVRRWI